MPINKIVDSFDEAVADIEDGAVILVGGFGTVVSAPSCLLEAVYRKGVKNLTTVSNTSGFGADVWRMQGAPFPEDMDILVRNERLKKAIVSAPVSALYVNNFEKLLRAGKVEIEMVPQGTLAERVRAAKAGLGGVYVPTGIGTVVEEGKEKKVIDGREYLLELPIKGDFALIHAHKGDRWGNLVYRGTSRTFNPTMAGAARVTIAEVDEIVELGELDPEAIVTPGVYVDRVVARPKVAPAPEAEVADAQALESAAKSRAEVEETIRRAKERGLRHD
jgi:3-oxoadipate CoA-transferase alpha subunit